MVVIAHVTALADAMLRAQLKALRETESATVDHPINKELASRIWDLIGYKALCTIRHSPPSKKKACLLLVGPSNTGKTLIGDILSSGLKTGCTNLLTNSFALEQCHDCDVIRGEEVEIETYIDWWKKVLEGGPYVIERKARQSVIQRDWTPIIITANKVPWYTLSNIDGISLLNRCYFVTLSNSFLRGLASELELLNIPAIASLLDTWIQEKANTELSTMEAH